MWFILETREESKDAGRQDHLLQKRAIRAFPRTHVRLSARHTLWPRAPRGGPCTHPSNPSPFQKETERSPEEPFARFPRFGTIPTSVGGLPGGDVPTEPGRLRGCGRASPSACVAAPASGTGARFALRHSRIDPNVSNNRPVAGSQSYNIDTSEKDLLAKRALGEWKMTTFAGGITYPGTGHASCRLPFGLANGRRSEFGR